MPDPLAPYRFPDGTLDVDALELGVPTPSYTGDAPAPPAEVIDLSRARVTSVTHYAPGDPAPDVVDAYWESLTNVDERLLARARARRRRLLAEAAWAFAGGLLVGGGIVGGLLLAHL